MGSLQTLPFLYNYSVIVRIWSLMLQDFQLILCLTIFYFRVNPLYTKHVLKSVEHYFSRITVWKKITKTWPNLGGGYPHFGKNRTLSGYFFWRLPLTRKVTSIIIWKINMLVLYLYQMMKVSKLLFFEPNLSCLEKFLILCGVELTWGGINSGEEAIICGPF